MDGPNVAVFAQQIEEALGHVNDHFYLQLHPLGALVAADAPQESRGRRLSQMLVESIDILKPAHSGPGTEFGWRKYRYLWLRYLEGHTAGQVASMLGLSERQARRDHRQAVDAVLAIFWNRYQGGPREGETSLLRATAAIHGDLDTELARLVAHAPQGPMALTDILREAVKTVAPLAMERGCSIDLKVGLESGPLAASPLILRHALVGLLTAAIEGAVGTTAVRVLGGIGIDACEVHIEFSSADAWRRPDLVESSLRLANSHGARVKESRNGDDVRFLFQMEQTSRLILIVIDDNPDLAQLFQRFLGKAYRVIQTDDIDGVPSLVARERPSAITLDVMMPTIDGWEVLRRLKADIRTSDVPIVICSVLQEASLARALGAAAFLAKPVSPLQLRSTLEQCCRILQQ